MMRLAVSNIAWDVTEDDNVATLLRRHDVAAIDVAPGKYFPDPKGVALDDVRRVRKWWEDRGIEITGMQALLFGTIGLNVFGTVHVQEVMLEHLDAVCRIAASLGATRLVFGSPRNRDRNGLGDEQSEEIAIAFFRRLGNIAGARGVLICLEPNPPRYGGNFMTTTDQAAWIVQRTAHPAIRLQLDTGALAINAEDPAAMVAEHADLIGHVHASEPDLVTLGNGAARHDLVSAALSARLPNQLVSIEMLASKDKPHLVELERALEVANRYYCPAGARGGAPV